MTSTLRLPCLLAVLLLSIATPLTADDAKPQRPRQKPGEVNAPPDLSQRWTDALKLGDPAPEFTLPLLTAPTPNAKRDPKDPPPTISLADLRSRNKPII